MFFVTTKIFVHRANLSQGTDPGEIKVLSWEWKIEEVFFYFQEEKIDVNFKVLFSPNTSFVAVRTTVLKKL